MLRSLYILNYAIIDELTITFSERLNVITGETGAGKSILMGALSLILGDRADTSVLLHREKKCIVEGVFTATSQRVRELMQHHDLDTDDGSNEIVIRREIAANGKSRAFVNDTPVNLEQLRQVSSQLVDLHRQFDTLTLSDGEFQRNVLDALAANSAALVAYTADFHAWKRAVDELSALETEKASFTREYDYNRFLFDELAEAALQPEELEDADAELKRLENSESIRSALTEAGTVLTDGESPIVQQLRSLQQQLGAFTRYHSKLEEIVSRLHSTQIELQDVAEELALLGDDVTHDPQRIEALNERISIGYKLLKKHGVSTTAGLLEIKDQLQKRLEAVMNIDDRIAELEKLVAEKAGELNRKAASLSKARHAQVEPFEKKVNTLLQQVGMPNARLKVKMEPKNADATGADEIQFLFNANMPSGKKEDTGRFEPIRKVASGGELSRLMLSIKSLVAETMDLPTLIFDEIDTGISGEAARQVGTIMHTLADKRQVITITHQPQIAGRAHTHLFVYKDVTNDNVRTNIRMLSREERITAIAKMLSGEKPTAAALENAREMVMN